MFAFPGLYLAVLGSSWGRLGPSCWRLGAVLALFGVLLRLSWPFLGLFGAPLGPKMLIFLLFFNDFFDALEIA